MYAENENERAGTIDGQSHLRPIRYRSIEHCQNRIRKKRITINLDEDVWKALKSQQKIVRPGTGKNRIEYQTVNQTLRRVLGLCGACSRLRNAWRFAFGI